MGKKGLDWEKIKSEYVSGDKTLKILAKENGVCPQLIGRHSINEKWVAARKKYRENKAKTALKKIEAKQSTEEANRLLDIQQAGLVGASKILALMEEMDDYKDARGLVSTTDIRNLTAALKEMQQVIRVAFDIPTRAEIEHLRIEREKLELERLKARTFTDDEDNETGIVVIPAREIDDAEEEQNE